MKILIMERELDGVGAEEFSESILKKEAEMVLDYYHRGIFRDINFRRDKKLAVIVMECEDLSEAEALVDKLPLVDAGLIAFDFFPLRPYDGFSRLN